MYRARSEHFRHLLTLLLFFLLAATLSWSMASVASAQEEEEGYIYTVQPGDNWTSVATRVGLTESELRAANPGSVRATGWLIIGEKLFIPTAEPVEEEFYEVQRGQGWTVIAKELGVSVRLLQAVNPRYVRVGQTLYVGDRLLVPQPAEAPAPSEDEEANDEADSESAEAEEEPVAETVEEAAVEEEESADTPSEEEVSEEAEPTPTPTPAPTATETPDPTAEPTAEPAEEEAAEEASAEEATTDPLDALPECPEEFSGYASAMADSFEVDSQGDPIDGISEKCGVVVERMQGPASEADEAQDLAIVYRAGDPENYPPLTRPSNLLLLAPGSDTPSISFDASAAGVVEVVEIEDINGDGQIDVVWTDTTCGASTCFVSTYVRSWDGSAWQDWTQGTVTMASAEVELAEIDEAGAGMEIVVAGGEYGSVGAGPQRGRTEVWASPEGAPYQLFSTEFAESDCLYHLVLDAERAVKGEDLLTATTLYEEALTNQELKACWVRENEIEELRSFSLYRLAQIAGQDDDLETAALLIDQLNESYSESPFATIGSAWIDGLGDGDMEAACGAVIQKGEEDESAVASLADYGYANPSFQLTDLCLGDPEPDSMPAESDSGEAVSEEDETEEGGAEEATEAMSAEEEVLAGLEDLPQCPDSAAEYGESLASASAAGEGDPLIIEAWMRVCDALADDRGALEIFDLNRDGFDDLLAFPTVISDIGYGPEGAEGTVLIFHGSEDGTFTLAYNPEVFGKPSPLTLQDANGDQLPELLWQVESCSTFCVTSVQGVVWDGEEEEYVDVVHPGAALAEGEAILEPVGQNDPGLGLQIRLVGGVSGTPGGGLTVAHTETWQSVDGAPYRRIRWQYARDGEGSDCLGLRLVEADVALQASDLIGYEEAIAAYQSALEDAELSACSLFGIGEEDELSLLQGLASFRLIQALALNGDVETADSVLASLAYAQPEGEYTEAATTWFDTYSAEPDTAGACAAVEDIFADDASLWQVTDQYGYDHPALAAEQICYQPLAQESEEQS